MNLKPPVSTVGVLWIGLMWPIAMSYAGGTVTTEAMRDNTLFEYHSDAGGTINSNGMGNFFSAGRTLSRGLIRRGLLAFELPPLPPSARVVPNSAHVDLYVVSAPRQDATARPVWLTSAPAAWSEGTSSIDVNISGAGSGVPAQDGDATWWHTSYDSATHAGVPFDPQANGFWPLPGALSDSSVDPYSLYGDPLAMVPSDVGPVSLRGSSLEMDINNWLQGAPNWGWLVVGDETITADNLSSLRSYASHEHVNLDFHPLLTFDYVVSDLTGDGTIDAADAGIMFAAWGSSDPASDFNQDAMVDAADAGILFEEWTGDSLLSVPEPHMMWPHIGWIIGSVFASCIGRPGRDRMARHQGPAR